MQKVILNNRKPETPRKKIVFLVFASLCMLVAFLMKNTRLYTLLNVGFTGMGLLIDPLLPLCLNIAMTSMGLGSSVLLSVGLKCLMTFPVFIIYIQEKSGRVYAKDVLFVIAIATMLLLSWAFGVDTQLTTAVLQMMTWMCYLVATKAHTRKNDMLLLTAFILNGVYMAGIVLQQLLTNSADMSVSGRLTFEGSVRTLSTAMAFPIFMIASRIISPGEKKLSIVKTALYLLILLIMAALLVITYSRGVLIAVILAVGYILLAQLRHMKMRTVMLYIVLLTGITIMLTKMEIDTDLMFSHIDGGNGRVSIWAFFFRKMGEHGIVGYLFGLGPGDILRISKGTVFEGYYSHSVLLDYIFSYGLLGGCLLIYMVVRALKAALRSKNTLSVAVLILAVTTYATHGNSASLAFPVLVGLAHSMAETETQKRRQLQPDSQQQVTDFGRRVY